VRSWPAAVGPRSRQRCQPKEEEGRGKRRKKGRKGKKRKEKIGKRKIREGKYKKEKKRGLEN
jgi:hypothetical protein